MSLDASTKRFEVEPMGYFSLPTRIFERNGTRYSINHLVILHEEDTPPKTELLRGTIRISMPATIEGERVGWWSGVYVEPDPQDSDYPGLPHDLSFGD